MPPPPPSLCASLGSCFKKKDEGRIVVFQKVEIGKKPEHRHYFNWSERQNSKKNHIIKAKNVSSVLMIDFFLQTDLKNYLWFVCVLLIRLGWLSPNTSDFFQLRVRVQHWFRFWFWFRVGFRFTSVDRFDSGELRQICWDEETLNRVSSSPGTVTVRTSIEVSIEVDFV